MKLRDLFEPEPEQWGQRGDSYLWKECKAQLGVVQPPDTEQELVALLSQTIEELVGEPLTKDGQYFVDRFAHGGMSSGWVSGEWWLVKGIPLLVARWLTAR